MATVKYWDDGKWVYAYPPVEAVNAVPVAGTTMTGPLPLHIDAGNQPYDIVAGSVTAGRITTTLTGTMNVGVGLTSGRNVDFGGAEVKSVKSSTNVSGAVTKVAVDSVTRVWDSLPVSLGSPWTKTADPSHQSVYARRNGDGMVMLGGLVGTNQVVNIPATSYPILQLPAGWRPAKRHLFSTFCTADYTKVIRVDVRVDGNVVVVDGIGSIPAGDVLSLDGISFYLG